MSNEYRRIGCFSPGRSKSSNSSQNLNNDYDNRTYSENTNCVILKLGFLFYVPPPNQLWNSWHWHQRRSSSQDATLEWCGNRDWSHLWLRHSSQLFKRSKVYQPMCWSDTNKRAAPTKEDNSIEEVVHPATVNG
jgi:hypothetical protein